MMNPLQKETLAALTTQMASHTWESSELSELVDPKLGIITGFQDLLFELEVLRRLDLGNIPPALSVKEPSAL